MLAAPLLIQHSFSIHFPRVSTMRRNANMLEDALAQGCPNGYAAPQVLPIPEELGPDVPRIIFNSINGFSNIAVTQTAMALTVSYSEDWQGDRAKCVSYLKRRAHVLFDMVGKLEVLPGFVGVGTRLRVMSDANDAVEVMAALRRLVAPDLNLANASEIMVRFSNNINNIYFDNATVSNAVVWPDGIFASGRFPISSRLAVGLEILGDFNNRLAYNEDVSHIATLDAGLAMIDAGAGTVYGLAGRFGGDHA
ncbi:hypothetical protein EC912_101747 [Luteibacter rhizovicinus]|uniref:Uncharacterized protein n=1 Tax=Luteibacter rhizovicinus TaxID=242606 RepID=A0A4R3YYJ7_9GAMM|nr:hypothetical protein [Luteibacter rhizovicinus]TCV97730.1 hypothetical protein EC912_101747 [Luteibacter rhizovicinus]